MCVSVHLCSYVCVYVRICVHGCVYVPVSGSGCANQRESDGRGSCEPVDFLILGAIFLIPFIKNKLFLLSERS